MSIEKESIGSWQGLADTIKKLSEENAGLELANKWLRAMNTDLKDRLEKIEAVNDNLAATSHFTVYDARRKGREYLADNQGSDHYKQGGVEPMDLIIASGMGLDFCRGNIIKYAARHKVTGNVQDLVKVRDYADIAIGLVLEEGGYE